MRRLQRLFRVSPARSNIAAVAACAARRCSGVAPDAAAFYEEVENADDIVAIESRDGAKVRSPGLAVDLYPFQRVGVQWMLHREETARGGIMADHLGMGKTVQLLGLCAAQRERLLEQQDPKRQKDAPLGAVDGAPATTKSGKRGALRLTKGKTAAPPDAPPDAPPAPSPRARTSGGKIDPRDPTLGPKLLLLIRQMQRVAVIGNCTSIVRPGMELFALHERIEARLVAAREARTTPDFTEDVAEVEKWLEFSRAYHPPFERHARWFLETESVGAEDFDQRKSPEMRTLIVVPAALLHQWHTEIKAKMARNCSVHVFHGGGRRADPVELEVCDFVLTTYDTLTHQLPRSVRESLKRKSHHRRSLGGHDAARDSGDDERLEAAGPLFHVNWKRIILDEAHVVRHGSTVRWRAVRALKGGKRWAVTATPVHNSIEDLQTLLEFIHAPTLPLLQNAKATLVMDANLQRIVARALQPLLLRRAPVMTLQGRRVELVRLPRITEDVIMLDLSPREAAVYNEALAAKRATIAQSEHHTKKAMHIFALMTNLRQICCHHWLSAVSTAAAGIYRCGLCAREAVDPTVAPCGHAFCRECLHNRFHEAAHQAPETGDGAAPQAPLRDEDAIAVRILCPTCDAPLGQSVLRKHHLTSREHISMIKRRTPFESSTKVDRLIEHVLQLATTRPDEKLVVFSHFTKFLDIIGVAFEARGVEFVRIDGTMPLQDRSTIISVFQRPGTARVLLASKTASGVGLNLTMANHVVIVDPWWNPAIEDQAVHRCHRIGQQRDVAVERFVIRGTIEAYCFEISQKKRDFGKAVLHAATNANAETQQRVVHRLEQVVNSLGFLRDEDVAKQVAEAKGRTDGTREF